jgi:hypothetical protein
VPSASAGNTLSGTITVNTSGSRINSDANTLTLSNATSLAIGTNVLYIGGVGGVTVNGSLTGSGVGSLNKDGTGTSSTLTLRGNSTGFTGSFVVAANSNILWTGTPATTGTSFQSSLSVSQQFIQYGLNMILPAINLPNLYNTGGTNDGNPPNLYYYQYSSNNTNPPTEDVSGWITIPYTKDTGAVSFFNSIFGIEQPDIGGYIQWIDGTLTNIN